MPRHRRERVPSHRAQRHAESPARRARVTAAVDTAIAVLDDARPEDPDAADTVPLPSSAVAMAVESGSSVPAAPGHARGRRRSVHSRVSTHTRSKRAGVLRGAARGLLVTPWFAAASGFVIAASLWIYSPHALLQFPDNAIGLQLCHDGCSQAGSQQGSGSLATSGKGRLADPRRSGARAGSAPRVRNRPAASGLTFSYYFLPSQHGRFTIRISVSGKRAIKDWRLTFDLRGDRIRQVWGADWQRTTPRQRHGERRRSGRRSGPATGRAMAASSAETITSTGSASSYPGKVRPSRQQAASTTGGVARSRMGRPGLLTRAAVG